MNSQLEKQIRAAVRAGWHVAAIEAVILFAQYFIYLYFSSNRSEWFAAVWGSGITWSEIQFFYLGAIIVMKLILFATIMINLWLYLWARQLER